jgi:hypothetical protein
MSTQSDLLRILSPEFADVLTYPDGTVDTFIGLAMGEISVTVWGSTYTRGSVALGAHLMKMAKNSAADAVGGLGGAGNVSQIKTGDEMISFESTGVAQSDAKEAALRSTKYGLEYLRLRSQVSGHPLMIT